MSPPRREMMMNGIRPTPLNINKESHLIQKPSSSAEHQQKRQGPIIIYTHSPKIIHTQARDFMALVQRLTGMSKSDREVDQNTAPVRKNRKVNRQEDNETSSGITDENGGSCVPTTTMTVGGMSPFFADMPLFTPSSTDFFCSPRPVHRFGDMGTLNSPTLLEFLKGLPDY
ncbi:hypothetical protein F3Y22_tig00110864pilonHSYRG00281 [Hibiscus syriacus]|uniref:VQ domain-containing protein n=1 Tax=Hibiscus syriacus TaxID=106335 RepID=A0A6A2ZIW3_HIBSY|nr:VQ motif-containing protein 8, chloroplastic-like [Hibiscus syriacus]KAE8691974.1 hypothetical protein F3Y22_tig00110864pilonHSYRG00281 [Hibiscus syriacus]